MFLSAEELTRAFGVDPYIAKTYVDRPVPVGNAYWRGRHLYIPPVTGYLFLPLFSDLCLRCGVPREGLLSEAHLTLAEAVLDSAARQESDGVDFGAHVLDCLDKARGVDLNPDLLEALRARFQTGEGPSCLHPRTPFPSLNRADTYLLSLCSISFGRDRIHAVTRAWHSLMPFFLVFDDLSDVREDMESGQENAFLEAGLTREGVERVMDVVDAGLSRVSELNPVLGGWLVAKRKSALVEERLGPLLGAG